MSLDQETSALHAVRVEADSLSALAQDIYALITKEDPKVRQLRRPPLEVSRELEPVGT